MADPLGLRFETVEQAVTYFTKHDAEVRAILLRQDAEGRSE
ncbi:hypothetical protein [Nocardioides sp. KR10-350]